VHVLPEIERARHAAEILGKVRKRRARDDLAEEGIADLLWAVCMLPEFQTIR
jgi:hypothetical protein